MCVYVYGLLDVYRLLEIWCNNTRVRRQLEIMGDKHSKIISESADPGEFSKYVSGVDVLREVQSGPLTDHLIKIRLKALHDCLKRFGN